MARGRPVRKGPRIALLSRNAALHATRRLVEACDARGARPEVIDTLACQLLVAAGTPTLLLSGKPMRLPDVALPRIGASITPYGLAVVGQLELLGVPVANGARGIATSRDKLRGLQALAGAGVRVPRSVLVRSATGLSPLVEAVGGLPVIVKLLQGTQGVGVMIAHSMEELRGLIGTFTGLGREVLLQQFVAEARGADVRVLVVGDRVIGAMRRKARRGEFRSNLHRGGDSEAVEPDEELTRTAIAAAQVVGLEIAGVDLLESRSGPCVMEVNSSPGFEGLEAATGKDVAGAIADHLLIRAGRP